MKNENIIEFFAPLEANSKIDKQNGIIKGVSIITSGVTARGHELEVDTTTLKQIHACALEKGGNIPVKENHKSGVEAVTGFVTNFRIEGNKLKADWHLLETHPRRAQYLETAEKMPNGVGMSAAFIGADRPEMTANGKPAARCKELLAVDYVTMPAANPDGMFSRRFFNDNNNNSPTVDNQNTSNMNGQNQNNEPTLAQVMQALQGINERLEQQDAFNAQLQEAMQSNDVEGQDDLTLEDIAQMDESQLAQLGLTVEDVQAALDQAAQGEEGEGEGEQNVVQGNFSNQAGDASGQSSGQAAVGFEAQINSLTSKIIQLEAMLKANTPDVKADAIENAFSVIEEKVVMLSAENDALRHALAQSNPRTRVTPGVVVKGAIHGDGSAKSEYDSAIEFSMKSGKSKGEAIRMVRNENPELYQAYLGEIGVIKM